MSLNICACTVEAHEARLVTKPEARNVYLLVRFALAAEKSYVKESPDSMRGGRSIAATTTFETFGKKGHGAMQSCSAYSTLPGFIMPCGSSAALILRIRSISSGDL